MANELRTLHLDAQLQIEAYQFQGIMQKFSPHFHEYYVIGFIEAGQRQLICKGKEYIINPGDLLLFNPYDIHSCEQIDHLTLDYRCINVSIDVMREFNQGELPYFAHNVLVDHPLTQTLKQLHSSIVSAEDQLAKEALFQQLLQSLIEQYTDTSVQHAHAVSHQHPDIQTVCHYLEQHYSQTVTLAELSDLIGYNKYQLIRAFQDEKKITPYNYLETIRINKAKELLEQGTPLIEVAIQTGFSDQSHFSKFFKKMVGLTPKQYLNVFRQERLSS